MDKVSVEAAITALEATGRTIDNWVLIFAAGVAICLTVEVVFSVAHWQNEKRLRSLRAELARIHTEELTNLKTVAEEAKARAKEAELALEKFKAPRTLTPVQRDKIIESLKPFGKVQFDMAVDGAEAIDFAILVAERVLAKANWQWVPWTLGGGITNLPGRVQVGIVTHFGVAIQVYNPGLEAAAQSLAKGMTDAGIERVRVETPNAILGLPGTNVMHIMPIGFEHTAPTG